MKWLLFGTIGFYFTYLEDYFYILVWTMNNPGNFTAITNKYGIRDE